MSRNKTMKTATSVFALTAFATQFGVAMAEDPSLAKQTVDISGWKCGYCEFEEGFSGEVELGAGNVSDDSYKFGEYNGMNEEGAFAVANATARYRNENADYVDLNARNVGLDSRSLRIEAGRQGLYDVFLSYQELPHFITDSAVTPYRGNGNDTLTLPASWVPSNTTAGMTALDASLRGVELDTKRKRLGIGLDFIPTAPWKYAVQFRRDTKEGQKGTSGAFLFRGAQLVEPVDYVTDQVDVSAAYRGEKWQATLAYYGSFFSNDDRSLTWQNAFTPGVAGADTGERALPPDNQFHQLLASAGYQLSDSTRLSGDIAVGRMEQDEDFLRATRNDTLVTGSLPAKSLDGQVDTLTANLKVHSRPSERLRVNGALSYSDRDNKTPREDYTWVTTDSYVNAKRSNLPYSFTRKEVKLDADYRVESNTRLGLGFDHDNYERTHQEVKNTDENTLWGKVSVRALDNMDITLKLARADRDISKYQQVNEIDPAENPLMRKYNMADRIRYSSSIIANASPHERVTVGVNLDFSKDDYNNSTLGLTDAWEVSVAVDASLQVTEDTAMHAFGGVERIRSKQLGSSTYSTPNWQGKNDDTVNTAGIGVTHVVIKDKLDVGADYFLMRATGEITVDNDDFPDLKNDRDTVKLYANYQLKESMSLHAAYWYENYDSENWSVAHVNPDTMPGVLAFGEDDQSYDVHVVSLSLRYKF